MAQEQSCPISHLTDSAVPNEHTTAQYNEEIISIPDIVKYCIELQAGAKMWCRSPRQPWRQDYSCITKLR